ncbi:hypothetical protein ABIE91_005571 [Bradyrhizobium elkanii]
MRQGRHRLGRTSIGGMREIPHAQNRIDESRKEAQHWNDSRCATLERFKTTGWRVRLSTRRMRCASSLAESLEREARSDHSMMLHPVDVIARQGAHERGEPSPPRKGLRGGDGRAIAFRGGVPVAILRDARRRRAPQDEVLFCGTIVDPHGEERRLRRVSNHGAKHLRGRQGAYAIALGVTGRDRMDCASPQRKIAPQFRRELLAMTVVQGGTASRHARRCIQARQQPNALRATSAWAGGPSAFPCP